MVTDHDYEVFISYRHNAANHLAEALYNEFQNTYSVNSFRDAEELHFGDFRSQLIKYNKRSNFLVLLLTPNMLDKCKNPGDWITTEISLFLKKKKPIIPILIDGFTFPAAEEMPEEIRGVLNHMHNAFTISTSNQYAVSLIARHVYNIIRASWKTTALREAIEKKEYLSRHNRENIEGYFYFSALDLRKYILLFIIQLFFAVTVYKLGFPVIANSATGTGLLLSILSVFLIYFDVKEFESSLYDHEVSFIDIVLDHSLIEIVKSCYLSFLLWIFPFLALFGGILLFNTIIDSAMSNGGYYLYATIHVFIVIPLLRFGFKLIISAANLLNSLFSPYPRNYLIYKAINKTEKVFKIIGWSLLVPAIIAANFLPQILG